ncbi:hypothetical protein DICPUDRAFT_58029 [Dictyostelium purpureum]|uniref:LMBR1-like conserved region-containing protein n=1 Tax=Dictyostelium purpureum TaxID=5786 RepID=F0ZYQ9_DICPU|nr:uncharacterized protein DICPUDRAFT_58029 [Dictyostelium purpureum]EGC30922.1 hypothetical protein DICPUDRAFT_58029 [Dictyostelium purpureum]|eukprot:XP_003292551.1 hypothetical protein DICPUDRAFT_58029 [Dictyostelium purpureum]
MISIDLGWVIFAGCILFVIALNYIVVKYYSDKHESEAITTIIAVIGLTLTLLCVMLIPVDILNVSTMSKNGTLIDAGTIASRTEGVKMLYYILYGSIIGVSLILVPFAYFFYEEYDENIPVCSRVYAGCKYTVFFVLFAVVLLVVGAFVRPGSKSIGNENIDQWIKDEVLNQNAVESSLLFAIACLTILGFAVWITYTAYGLSAFPIGLIKGNRRTDDDKADLNKDLFKTREKSSFYSSKYASGKSLTEKEQSHLSLLKGKERALEKRSDRLDKADRGIKKVLVIFRPFAFIFGFIFILLSFLIVISLVLAIIDKISSSVCGSACGFLSTYPKLKNPFDIVLLDLAPYFPLDYILLGGLILYIYVCALSGITRIGIRFLWINMFEFSYRKTFPQGLLIASVLLMLSNLCLNMQIVQLAPRYVMYGTQQFFNATSAALEPCNISAPQGACVMSQIGSLTSRIQLGTSFFGIIFYYATWVIIGFFLVGLVVSIFKKAPSKAQYNRYDEYEDEI